MSILCLLALQAQAWVVRDAIPPEPAIPGSELGYGPVIACGDLDGDSSIENYRYAFDFPFTQFWFGTLRGGKRQDWVTYDVPLYRMGLAGPAFPQVALTRTPTGGLIVYLDGQHGWLLHSRTLPDPRRLIAASASLQPAAFKRFADVNGDGWDEIFCQDLIQSTGYARMVDGQSLALIWSRTLPDSESPSMLSKNTAQEYQDIDGDLIPDPIAVWTTYYPQSGVWDHSIQAFSGASGTQLWENRAATSWGLFIPSVGEHDLTQDGIHDVILANAAIIKLVSGSDGSTVWSRRPEVDLLSAVPPGWMLDTIPGPAVLTPMPGTGALQLVVAVRFWEASTFSIFHLEFAHFDPYTGAFLGLATLPQDLQPWSTDQFWNPRGDSIICARGDVDRDGLQEISFGVPAPAYDLAWTGIVPAHFVTLGLPTLTIPATLRIGFVATAQVSIPSAPQHDFFVVASRTFDRRGGVRLDGWRTHLADDPWLTWTTASRTFAGTLDGAGNGTARIAVPMNPALSGTTLYTRAVILAPGGQEIWTLSTLGTSTLVP